MEKHKSIFEHEIVNNKQKVEYLWNNVIAYWREINSVAYLREYLTSNPIRLLLGTNYQIFMKNYNITKFYESNDDNLWDSTPTIKQNIETEDLVFLEVIFNEINYKIEEVKLKQFGTSKANMFCSLPEIINDLVSALGYSFIAFKTNNFIFQKLISSKNFDILKAISNKNNSLKSITTEYLLLNNQNNLQIKVRLLTDLYKFVDKQSKLIEKEFSSQIKNKIFSEMNNLNIRHDNQVQSVSINGEILYEFYDKSGKKFCELNKIEYIEKLDKLFQLIVMIANFLNLEMIFIS